METLANILKELRTQKELAIKEVAQKTKIDASLISRFENGERLPTKEQIKKLAKHYKVAESNLLISLLSEKIYNEIADEDIALQALQIAESRIAYKRKNFGDSEILKEIDSLKKQLDAKRPLPHAQLKKLEEYYKIAYTHESNKIEGNTLTLQETALVVEKGITISGKSVQEHLEAINHAEAVELLLDLVKNKAEITESLIKQIHGIILRGIDRENAGRYRNVNVRITGSKHIPPEPFMINKLMEDYIFFYEEAKERLHPVVLAAEMHERLVSIHPFIDGNGRTSRLVMNLILLKAGYPIANISGDRNSRLEYYKSLESVNIENNKHIFYRFIAENVLLSLKDYLQIIG